MAAGVDATADDVTDGTYAALEDSTAATDDASATASTDDEAATAATDEAAAADCALYAGADRTRPKR